MIMFISQWSLRISLIVSYGGGTGLRQYTAEPLVFGTLEQNFQNRYKNKTIISC